MSAYRELRQHACNFPGVRVEQLCQPPTTSYMQTDGQAQQAASTKLLEAMWTPHCFCDGPHLRDDPTDSRNKSIVAGCRSGVRTRDEATQPFVVPFLEGVRHTSKTRRKPSFWSDVLLTPVVEPSCGIKASLRLRLLHAQRGGRLSSILCASTSQMYSHQHVYQDMHTYQLHLCVRELLMPLL
jgi:hypothetical protein